MRLKIISGLLFFCVMGMLFKARAVSTPLHLAAERGDLFTVKELCESHESWLGEGDYAGKTPLHVAVLSGQFEVVRYLIVDRKVDVNQKNLMFPDVNALYYAVKSKNLDLVKFLVLYGVELTHGGRLCYMDALPVSFREDFLPGVEYLTTRISWKYGVLKDNRLLFDAILSKKLYMVKYAVDKLGLDVNAIDDRYGSALQFTVNLQLDTIRRLNRNVYMSDDEAEVRWLRISKESFELNDIIEYLVQHGAEKENILFGKGITLHMLVRFHDLELLRRWRDKVGKYGEVGKYEEVDQRDIENRTPLYYAVRSGNLPLVRYLVDKCGANIYAVDRRGDTMLHVALANDHRDVFAYLSQRFIYFNPHNFNWDTILSMAIEKGYTDVAEFLLYQNIDVNRKGTNGETALHIALDRGFFYIAKRLINKGADVNSVDNYGNTPLNLAIRKRSLDMVTYLISHGADVNLSNSNTDPPLFYATGFEGTRIFQFLVRQGANILALNREGYNVMDAAKKYHDFYMVEYLRMLGMPENPVDNAEILCEEPLSEYMSI